MKISVIIPTYKPKDYIWECLYSLSKQTLTKKDFEVILVLNGCAEPWKSKIENYISTNLTEIKVVFIHTTVAGVSNARNMALDIARGEYITFIDDDDYISASYLEKLLLAASKDVISLCYPLSFNDGSITYKSFYITKDYNKLYINKRCPWYKARRYFNGPVYKLIHSDIIGNRRFDTRFTHGEDSLFMFLISDRFRWVSFVSEDAVYFRRFREGSAMTTERSLINKVSNEWKLFLVKTSIYLSNPTKYSAKYYLRGLLGSIIKLIY